MSNKVISVIIPHYNSFGTLEKLLGSIPEDGDIEVLVVDDKSESAFRYDEIKQKFADRNIGFLSNDTDRKGAGTSRNIGLAHASGKWLLFADADDFFTNNAFGVIRKYTSSEADVIYFNMTSIILTTGEVTNRHDKDANLLAYYKKKNGNQKAQTLLKYEWGEPVGRLISRDLVEKNSIRFDEILVANDIMFSMKVAVKAKKIDVCYDTIYCITKSEGSLTQKKNRARTDLRIDVDIKSHKYLRDNLTPREYSQLGLCGLYCIVTAWKMYGAEYAGQVIGRFRKNKIPLIRMRILYVWWIEYHNRVLP